MYNITQVHIKKCRVCMNFEQFIQLCTYVATAIAAPEVATSKCGGTVN